MDSADLIKLERIARNLPCRRIEMEYGEGRRGKICFAYGVDPEGVPHGVWGYCGVAMTIEFKKEATVPQIRQVLVDAAETSLDQLSGFMNG